jgi:hypothetical protein
VQLLHLGTFILPILSNTANKDHHEKFLSLEEMQAFMRERVLKQKKRPADESSEDNNDDDE